MAGGNVPLEGERQDIDRRQAEKLVRKQLATHEVGRRRQRRERREDGEIQHASFEMAKVSAVKVELDAPTQARVMQQNAGNPTAFALLPVAFGDGVIGVDVAAEINGRGGPDVRGFAGIAFRVADDRDRFEAVYFRMTNGSLENPPPPRNVRAIQYIAHPEWTFDRLRTVAPGRYEAGARIGLRRWTHLRIDVRGTRASVFIDDAAEPALVVDDLKLGAGARGQVGLFVDDGTAAYFADLRVRPH